MGVECGTTCTASYAAQASVTLAASPGSGSTFSSWSGACTGAGRTCTVSMTADQAVTATFSTARPFTNPVLWEDLPDPDVLRVDDTYYALGSSLHYSPGAPILRSYDLVNWEPAGHAVPVLDVSPSYDLNGGRAYVKGIRASFLNYRKSNKTFYWGGCIGLTKTYVFTAPSVEGPWQKAGALDACYADPSLLIDDDDKMYVAYGNTTLSVAELTPDGLGQVRTQQVFTASFAAQSSRFYKVAGSYYILVSRPGSGEYVLRSTTGPFGPYTMQPLVDGVGAPVSGGGAPSQGGIVQTQSGDWYYLASMAAYPGGRFPILAPVTWSADGWPAVQLVNGAWGASYPSPAVPPSPRATRPLTGIDRFAGPVLGPDWEWNHNPDGTRWSFDNGLRLQAATVTTDLYSARNTLTHRILGPTSTATILLDHAGMKDGDRAGLVLLRDTSAWVGVLRDGGATRVAMMHGLFMDGQWNTTGTGGEASNAPVSGNTIWLRASADITPGAQRQARFSYSTDGVTFTPIGIAFAIDGTGDFLLGYRFGLFNYATQALGGVVTVRSFELAVP
jgi:beta-xylosidase